MWESAHLKKVYLFKQDKYVVEEVCEKLISVLVAEKLDVEKKDVYLAPGWESIANGEAVNTHPAVVTGAAVAFHRMGARVTVGENLLPGVSVMERLMSPSMRSLLKSVARISPCARGGYVTVKIRKPFARKEFRVPREWFKADVAVALPKVKTNVFCDLSTSAWTLLNLLERKERAGLMDDLLSMKMADLARTRPPDIVVADGIVAGEGQGPLFPSPVQAGVLTIGNFVSADAVCARLAGLEPHYIDHLRLLAEQGIGRVDVNAIAVNDPELLRAGGLKKASWTIEKVSERIQVHGGSTKFCPSGCVGVIRQALDAAAPILDKGRRVIHVVVGEPVDIGEFIFGSDAVLVGECAENYSGKGTFVPGRSPEPESVELAVVRALKGGFSPVERFKLLGLRLLGAPVALRVFAVRRDGLRNSDGAPVSGAFIPKLAALYTVTRVKRFFVDLIKNWFTE